MNNIKEKDEVDLSAMNFGQLLVFGRRNGIGQPSRAEKTQEDFANAIFRSVDSVRGYENNKNKPPEKVFFGKIEADDGRKEPRGIVQFFTRIDPDPEELDFVARLRAAYTNWPGGQIDAQSNSDCPNESSPTHVSETEAGFRPTEPADTAPEMSAKPTQPTGPIPHSRWPAIGAIAAVITALFAITQFAFGVREAGRTITPPEASTQGSGNIVIQGDNNSISEGDFE